MCQLREQYLLRDASDASDSVRKLRERDHQIKECTGDPPPMLCKGKTGLDDRNVTGYGRCSNGKINLNYSEAAQHLLSQTIRESDVDEVLI